LIVSQFDMVSKSDTLYASSVPGLTVAVEHAQGEKCPRCWNWDTDYHADGLCDRCWQVLHKD